MSAQISKTLILAQNDIHEIVAYFGLDEIMDALIDKLSEAIRNLDENRVVIPIRSGFNYTEPFTGLIEWMPLLNQKDKNQVVMKVVGYHPQNPARYELPTIVSTISAYDTNTGHLIGLMDGVFLTALRTGAASAVASSCLAAPDSTNLGLIGCGAQSITQLHALSRTLDIQRVFFYDSDSVTRDSFRERCAILNLDVSFVPSNIEEIVNLSDIICTATSIEVGRGPLFSGLETKPHVHINAIGSDFPGKIELPIELLTKSYVCPDFREQAVKEGECQQLEPHQIGDSLSEVVQNPDRYVYLQNERSVFDSTGWALEDLVVMELFMEYAVQLKLGREIAIETTPMDAKNPYDFMVKLPDNDLLQQVKNAALKQSMKE